MNSFSAICSSLVKMWRCEDTYASSFYNNLIWNISNTINELYHSYSARWRICSYVFSGILFKAQSPNNTYSLHRNVVIFRSWKTVRNPHWWQQPMNCNEYCSLVHWTLIRKKTCTKFEIEISLYCSFYVLLQQWREIIPFDSSCMFLHSYIRIKYYTWYYNITLVFLLLYKWPPNKQKSWCDFIFEQKVLCIISLK